MSKIVCNIEETVCTPSSNPTVTGAYIRCNIDDPSCIESTPTEGGGGGVAAPTYNLSGPSSINENESGVFTVTTTGVDEGLLIPYTLTGVQSADVVGGSLTGTFEIDANGAGSVTIQMIDDFVAEGETMTMTIGSALNPLDFINVNIVDPVYSLSSAGTMIEGNSLLFNLTTTGISNGQTRNWDITGSGHSLSATSGTFTINSNTASVSISSVYDALYQGTSNFTFRVFGSDGVTVADTINFTVTDASSTYSQSSASAFDEGTSLTVTVATTNVQDSTTLYWTINHGTTSTADFTAESGSFIVTSNSGSFNIEAVADLSTEGAETFSIELRTGSITGPIVDTSSSITINDTSINISYSQSSATSVDEGSSLAVTVSTVGVPDSTTLYWTINHGTTSTADFTVDSGSFTITSNSGSFNIETVADLTTEGAETFTIELRTGSISGPVVDTSSTITINDTSINISYSQSSATSVNEGASLAVTVSTVGVPDATTLYWTVNHGTTVSADFTADSGSFTITSNSGSFNIDIVADSTLEGSETFTIELRTGSIAGPVVDTSSTITINDTSANIPDIYFNEWYAKGKTTTSNSAVDYELVGTNKNLFGTNSLMPEITDEWSMSFYINVDGKTYVANSYDCIFAQFYNLPTSGAGLQVVYYCASGNVDTIRIGCSDGTNYQQWFFTMSNTIQGWRHIIITKNNTIPTSSNNPFTVYENGATLGYWTPSNGSIGTLTSSSWTNKTVVNTYLSTYHKYLAASGALDRNSTANILYDELAFYSKELSFYEANAIYNNGVPVDLSLASTTLNLESWFRFGDGSNDNTTSHYSYDVFGDTSRYFASTNSADTTFGLEQLTNSDSIYIETPYALDADTTGSFKINEPIPFTSSWSISFWFKTSTNTGNNYNICWYPLAVWDGPTESYPANFQLAGLSVQVRANNNTSYVGLGPNLSYISFSHNMLDGNWHNMILTWDGSYVGGNSISGAQFSAGFNIYIDGTSAKTGSGGTASPQSWMTTSDYIGLGNFTSSGSTINSWATGFTDDLAIWTGTELTSTEASLIYNSGVLTDLQNTANVTVPTRYFKYQDNNNLNKDTISGNNIGTISSWVQILRPT